MSLSRERTPRKLLGFRSGNPWKSSCALAFFCLLYLVFVLTLMPPVVAGNHDLLVYKAIRAALFAIVILPIVFLSDFAWCKHVPFFSSPRVSQRMLGVGLLAALLVCLCANLAYLHTPEYRAAATHRTAMALGVEDANMAASKGDATMSEEVSRDTGQEPDLVEGESMQNAWTERREGCGTD